MHKMSSRTVLLCTVLILFTTGCVTNKKMQRHVDEVDTELSTVNERVDGVESQVEANQTRLDEQGKSIQQASKTAQEALDRAIAAGKLAEGKFLYETVLSDDKVRFGFDKAELGDEARAALDAFASQLLSANESVFIEIQGHTDSIGGEEYNYTLGLERAESVRRYLNSSHKVPLHRMSVISYGEAEPVTDNKSRDARAQNRRVLLVVLK